MKKNTIKAIGFSVVAVVGFAACTGLGKMYKKAETVEYTVTPNPLEMHGDSIAVTVKGKYPEKYFGKKVVLTFNPKVKWDGGSVDMKPITIVGEKVKDVKGTVIQYKPGGSFSYTDKIAYQKGMENADLVSTAKGQVKKKEKVMPEKKFGDGTIVTPFLVKSDEKSLIGKDNFQRIIPKTQQIDIFYLINQSNVQPKETSKQEMKDFKKWVENTLANPVKYVYKNVSMSAYASPDGELSRNENLANDRAKSSMKYLQSIFKEKKTKFDNGTQDAFYQVATTAEDWAGFEKLMQESSIADKDLILNVLKMYPDGEVREKEIKNLSKTYREVADQILPKLRRSNNIMNYDVVGFTDEQLLKYATTTPDSLNVEEILYAGTLTQDPNVKLTIYKNAETKFGSDWRTVNNVGVTYLMLNKVNDAKSQFEKALSMQPNNAVVLNNLGICYAWLGDRKSAYENYEKAKSGTNNEVTYNMGIIDIKNGNYAKGLENFGGQKSFNVALLNVLNGNAEGALSILDESKDKEDAVADYLKAIIGARTGKTDLMINSLKSAIQKDASFKEKAAKDMEFFKYRDNADFKALVG